MITPSDAQPGQPQEPSTSAQRQRGPTGRILLLVGVAFVVVMIATALVIKFLGGESDRLNADEYHELIRDGVPSLSTASDEELDSLAESICEYFDEGGTWTGWVKLATDGGFTGEEAGKITPYAIYYACPDHAEKLPTVD